jgi:hypothetical protein
MYMARPECDTPVVQFSSIYKEVVDTKALD